MRFSAPVCCAMYIAMVLELNYRTNSESEEEEDVIALASSLSHAA